MQSLWKNCYKTPGRCLTGGDSTNQEGGEHRETQAGVWDLTIHFDLPKGCYATVILRELMRHDGAAVAGGDDGGPAEAESDIATGESSVAVGDRAP